MSNIHNKRQLASGISVIAIAAALTVASSCPRAVRIRNDPRTCRRSERLEPRSSQSTRTPVSARSARSTRKEITRSSALRPSDYSVTVDGQAPQTTSLQVGQTVAVDFVETRANGAIVVTGRRTAQPVQAQTVATNITPAQIENLPQNSRNFLSFAILAPGVTLSNPSGAQQFQVGALNADHSNVLLDGMSFKNPDQPRRHVRSELRLVRQPLPADRHPGISGRNPELRCRDRQSAGGVLNADDQDRRRPVPRHRRSSSGSRRRSSRGRSSQAARSRITTASNSAARFGGPIIPGKLSFYIAAEGVTQSLPAGSFNVTASVPQNIEAQVNGAVPADFHQGLYFGKLTYFMRPREYVQPHWLRSSSE